MKRILFLLLGYPGSGKSTFSKQLAEARGMIRVNSDEIRRRMFEHDSDIHKAENNPPVFGALDYVTEKLLAAGHSVLFDANNNRRRERLKGERQAASQGANMIVLWVQVPLETARQRADQRAVDTAYVPIPDDYYQHVIKALEPPTSEERAIIIDGLMSFDEQLQSFDAQLAELEQRGE